jgi:hypothetical protein
MKRPGPPRRAEGTALPGTSVRSGSFIGGGHASTIPSADSAAASPERTQSAMPTPR